LNQLLRILSTYPISGKETEPKRVNKLQLKLAPAVNVLLMTNRANLTVSPAVL